MTARPSAPVVRVPWRCRWFGHAWRKGLPALAGPVLYCARKGCVEERHWPPALPRETVVGVAPASEREP